MVCDQLVVGGSLQSCRQQGSIPWRASMDTQWRRVVRGVVPASKLPRDILVGSPSQVYGAALLMLLRATSRGFESHSHRFGRFA
jgi:hypothetical protein